MHAYFVHGCFNAKKIEQLFNGVREKHFQWCSDQQLLFGMHIS